MKILKTLGSAALIITFITGIWFIDDRYVDAKEIKTVMENAVDLEVPNKVDYESGPNWGTIK